MRGNVGIYRVKSEGVQKYNGGKTSTDKLNVKRKEKKKWTSINPYKTK